MPVTIADALAEAGAAAAAKAEAAGRSPSRYFACSALAGAYVGVAVVVLLSVAGPLAAAGSPATRLVAGAVFGVALTLVVFAGAELFTGNAMFMVQGLWARSVGAGGLAGVWAISFAGNVAGSVAFAAAVRAAGVLAAGGKPSPAATLLAGTVQAKIGASGTQLFWRAVLCNMLVCLGLWMATRTRSDAAKLVVLSWALLSFVVSGFEHSVANMTSFSLAVFQGDAGWGDLARNLAWTVPGNVLGGGLLVGVAYAWTSGRRSRPTPDLSRVPPTEAREIVPRRIREVPTGDL